MPFSFDYVTNISYICCMTYDMNKNYFIECGNDIDMVIDFLIKNQVINLFGGHYVLRKNLEIRKQQAILSSGQLGGILIENNLNLLWTSPKGVNDGHLERNFEPLIRVGGGSIIKHKKLIKIKL